MIAALLLAALALLPSDRMALADRLYDRGDYAAARREYAALAGAEGISADDLDYRLGECARALGDVATARAAYGRLLARSPLSAYAPRARLMRALSAPDAAEKARELKVLDADATPRDVRAAALYHLGVLEKDAAILARCVRLEPKGAYAVYAAFRRAALLAASPDEKERRTAVGEYLEIHHGTTGDMAEQALYAAGALCYGDKRYDDAARLFRRFLKVYPSAKEASRARLYAAWSEYLRGRYAEAYQLCEAVQADDAAYLRAACAAALGDRAKARALYASYLEDYPAGRSRAAAELAQARIDFDRAREASDTNALVAAAQAASALSRRPADALRLGWAYEWAGRPDDARAVYAKMPTDAPGSADAAQALYRLALMDVREGAWSPAEMRLAEALATGKLGADEASAHYWRGIAAFRLEHAAEGAALLRKALAKGLPLDEAREARLMLADDDYEAGRTDEAAGAYAQLVREGASARMGAVKALAIGEFLLARGDTEAAQLCAAEVLKRADSPEWRQMALVLRGRAEEKKEDFTSAIAAYRAALAEKARTESAACAALALGRLEARKGEYGQARKTLGEAVALNAGNNARRLAAYLELARVCAASGSVREARGYATVVLALFADKAAAQEAQEILDRLPEEAK